MHSSQNSNQMTTAGHLSFTGERFVPEVKGQIAYEHFHRYHFALEYVGGKTVLDVASGEGYGSALLAAHAHEVIGVDISEEAILHSSMRYADVGNLRFVIGSCENVPLADSTFDIVVSFETLEHIRNQRQFLLEVRRLLKPGGLFILSSPNRIIYTEKSDHHNPFHVRELNLEELQTALRDVFPHIHLFGQRMTFSSYLWPLDDVSYGEFRHYADKPAESSARPPFDAEYFLAICTDKEMIIPPTSSLYTNKSDELLIEYHGRGEWGQSLHKALAERDRTIRSLQNELASQKAAMSIEFSSPSTITASEANDTFLRGGESPEEARKRLEQVIQHDPDNPIVYNDLGVVYYACGDAAQARASFRKAVALDENYVPAQKNLADMLIQDGDFNAALRIYQGIVGRWPADVEALVSLGGLLRQAGRNESARYYFQHALEIDPLNSVALGFLQLLKDDASSCEAVPVTGHSPAAVISDAPNDDYRSKLHAEIHRYEHDINVHDLPVISHVVNAASLTRWLNELTGESDIVAWWAQEVEALVQRRQGIVNILSIGCGNGDIELDVISRLPSPGRVRLLGLDVNPAMIARANRAAEEKGLLGAVFEVADLNNVTLKETFDVVLASHSLHHIVELEKLFTVIDRSASDEMIFLVNDMIGRNGHVMWPATLSVVRTIWDSLDRKYKYNAYWKGFDVHPMNHDCSKEGFEGIRAQDILPLLMKQFDFDIFLPFSTIINRFTDRGYGHNFDPATAGDVDLIMRILALDIQLMAEKKLAPVQCLMKLRKKGTVQHLRCLFQTPEEVLHLRTAGITRDDYAWHVDFDQREELMLSLSHDSYFIRRKVIDGKP